MDMSVRYFLLSVAIVGGFLITVTGVVFAGLGLGGSNLIFDGEAEGIVKLKTSSLGLAIAVIGTTLAGLGLRQLPSDDQPSVAATQSAITRQLQTTLSSVSIAPYLVLVVVAAVLMVLVVVQVN
jgi:uncharacterized membrane protein YidH (DUF202 family)